MKNITCHFSEILVYMFEGDVESRICEFLLRLDFFQGWKFPPFRMNSLTIKIDGMFCR